MRLEAEKVPIEKVFRSNVETLIQNIYREKTTIYVYQCTEHYANGGKRVESSGERSVTHAHLRGVGECLKI